jgi:tetratricopeptide (TPR) repeat protein
LRGLIRERLARRSPSCREVLEAACVLGLRFELDLLQAVADREGGDLLDAVEEAAAAGILVRAARGRFAFVHALVRDALRESLSPSRRLGLHARALDALEKLRGHALGAVAGELAEHALALARAGGDSGKALLYSTRAAETAAARFAFDEAALHYGRALETLESWQPEDAVRRCDLLLARGEALWQAGRRTSAGELFLEAARTARGLRDAERLARAALGFADRFVESYGGLDTLKVRLLEEALRTLGDSPRLRIQLLVKLAVHLCNAEEFERADPLVAAAVSHARGAGIRGLEARALRAQAWLHWFRLDVEQALEISTRARDLSDRAGEPFVGAEAQLLRIAALVALGEVGRSDAEVERLARQIEDHRLLVLEHYLVSHRAGRAALAGRFQEAAHLAEQALACGERVESHTAITISLLHRIELWGAQGRLPELVGEIDAFASGVWAQVVRIPRCLLHAEVGRISEARREFDALAQEGFAKISPSAHSLRFVADMAAACALLGDVARARELYDLLLPYERLNIVVGYAQGCRGPASRFLGLLAATMQRWKEAEGHFEAALAMCARMGAAPLLARTQVDCARMLLARDRAGDRARARELLAPALASARELGMRPLAEEAAAALREAAAA